MKNKIASIITDNDFEQISLILKEPNIFKALSIERKEIRHSNFISYLLNPNQNHGLRDIVLRKFLRDIFSDEKSQNKSIFDADIIDLRNVEIRREWRNIDILIILNHDIILIENKIDSSDHSNQLKKYMKIAESENSFSKKNKHYVYLTPFGNDPNDNESKKYYINYSYFQIAEIINSILTLYKNNISDKINYYLQDYLISVKRELLMNDSLNEIALKVYNSHKDAFDFIFDNRPDPASILYPFFETEIKNKGFVIGSKNKGCIRFVTKNLYDILPKNSQGWPEKEAFLFEIDYFWTNKKAVIKATIAPGDQKTQETIIKAVQTHPKFQQPLGKKWLVFYINKFNFVASEIINETEEEINLQVKNIVDATAHIAEEFCLLIQNKLSQK